MVDKEKRDVEEGQLACLGNGMPANLRDMTKTQRWKRDMELYVEYRKLSAEPENSLTAIHGYLRGKYKFSSYSSTYEVVRRVEKRLALKYGLSPASPIREDVIRMETERLLKLDTGDGDA